MNEKAEEQAKLFATRLRKRAKHLRRWPSRRGITCFRLYERDITEIQLIVDRYEDNLHITEYERPHDRDPAQHANWLDLMARTASETLQVPKSNIFFKRRGRQRGTEQHEKFSETGKLIEVHEGGLKFLVNLSDYVDTGLFLDHRITRQMIREAASGATFLNLFFYFRRVQCLRSGGGCAANRFRRSFQKLSRLGLAEHAAQRLQRQPAQVRSRGCWAVRPRACTGRNV